MNSTGATGLSAANQVAKPTATFAVFGFTSREEAQAYADEYIGLPRLPEWIREQIALREE